MRAAGAIYANDTSNITVLDSLFELNGGGQGGAISVWNSSVLVNGTAFYRNMGNGAGVHNFPFILHIVCFDLTLFVLCI